MKVVLKIILWLLAAIVLLFAGTFVLVRIYERELVDAALRYFSEQQGMELRTESIEVGFLQAFPYATIYAEQTEIVAHKPELQLQISAAQMYISVNIVDLLRENSINVKTILLRNGEARIAVPKASTGNGISSALINLDKVRIQNFVVQFGENIVEVPNLELILLQNSGGLSILADGAMQLRSGAIADIHPILVRPAKIVVQMEIVDGKTTFADSRITIADSRVEFSGTITAAKVSISAGCKSFRLENAMQFVPQQLKKYADNLRGTAQVSLRIFGGRGARHKLQIDGAATISKASAEYENRVVELKSAAVSFSSTDIGNAQLYACTIGDAVVRADNFVVTCDASIVNFENPYIRVQAQVDGELNSLTDAFTDGTIDGSVSAVFVGNKLESVKAQLEVHDASTTIKNQHIDFSGNFSVATKNIVATNFKFKCNYAEGTFNGKIHNYLPLYYADLVEDVAISGTLHAKQIVADSLLNLKLTTTNSSSHVKLKVVVSADNLLIFNYLHKMASFTFNYNNDIVQVNNLIVNSFGGQTFGTISVGTTKKNGILSANLDFRNIQIDKISYLNHYFKSGSLLGTISGSIDGSVPVGESKLDFGRANGAVSFTIENGQMVNFEPAQLLSDYVKREHLQHIRFLTLKNTLTIANGTILVPPMEIRSSALNTHIEGAHYLNNDFDYYITLYFSELLRGKAQRLENPIKTGKTKVFLHAVKKNGSVSVDYTTDVGRKVKETLQQEKNSFVEAKQGRHAKRSAEQNVVSIDHEDVPQKDSKPTPAKPQTQKQPSAVEVEWEDE